MSHGIIAVEILLRIVAVLQPDAALRGLMLNKFDFQLHWLLHTCSLESNLNNSLPSYPIWYEKAGIWSLTRLFAFFISLGTDWCPGDTCQYNDTKRLDRIPSTHFITLFTVMTNVHVRDIIKFPEAVAAPTQKEKKVSVVEIPAHRLVRYL